MSWISRNGYLNQSEMENNANIIINHFRLIGINDVTISALLGNMESESTINPELEEVGGQGYGLVQWTPITVLQNHCNTLGLSPYNSGDVQLQVLLPEILGNPASVNEWIPTQYYIDRYSNSGSSQDMLGKTGQDFLSNNMGWTPDKLAILFMIFYLRPSYDPAKNHYTQRMQNALKWYEYMGGVIPPTPPTPTQSNRNKFPWVLYSRKLRNRRNFH